MKFNTQGIHKTSTDLPKFGHDVADNAEKAEKVYSSRKGRTKTLPQRERGENPLKLCALSGEKVFALYMTITKKQKKH